MTLHDTENPVSEADKVREALSVAISAIDIFVENEHKVVILCRDAGIDVDYCGNNAVSCVAELVDRYKALVSSSQPQ